MRLWHKDLIPVLPRQQLLGQWRELCLIAKNISRKGTPGHVLVNRIMDYPLGHLVAYADLVADEMRRRGYKVDVTKFDRYIPELNIADYPGDRAAIFPGWHDDRYLKQCYYNLQEKADAGAIPPTEYWRVAFLIIKKGLYL